MNPRFALIALVASLLASGCLGGANVPAADDAAGGDDDAGPQVHQFAGNLVKKEGEFASSAMHAFDVTAGATAVSAVVTWDGAVDVHLSIRSPDGKGEQGMKEKPGRVSLLMAGPPTTGEWTAIISGSGDAPIPYSLRVAVDDGPPQDESVESTLLLAGGQYAEANVFVEAGARVEFRFQSTKPVAWDVHTHDPETRGLTVLANGTSESHEGSFTAPARGLYSVSFGAKAGSATLQYGLDGVMRVHSYSQG